MTLWFPIVYPLTDVSLSGMSHFEQVSKLLGQPVEKLGDAQWIGHILKRLHLLDDARRKRGMDGMMYAVQPIEVIDMMRRYDVAVIRETH